MITSTSPILNGNVGWMLERERALSLSHNRYISILVELTRLEGTKHGNLISLQVLDVAVRVESIRQFACHQMVGSLHP